MSNSLPPISPLRGLLEVTRLLRAQESLPELLAAIARTIGECLGYDTVAIDVYRPEWDDFAVTTVHGNEVAREALVGRVASGADWDRLLATEFLRRGAYVIPAGAVDWSEVGESYIPAGERAGDDPDVWDPEDALFVPLRHQDGHLLGIVSADEPASGRRPSDEELDVLVALADHAALAVQASHEAAEATRHRRALEELLAVSSRLRGRARCRRDPPSRVRPHPGRPRLPERLRHPPRARTGAPPAAGAVGWSMTDPRLTRPLFFERIEPLLDRALRREGCYLLTNDEARRRVGDDAGLCVSQLNGRGRWAWNRHWLLVPLRDGEKRSWA